MSRQTRRDPQVHWVVLLVTVMELLGLGYRSIIEASGVGVGSIIFSNHGFWGLRVTIEFNALGFSSIGFIGDLLLLRGILSSTF